MAQTIQIKRGLSTNLGNITPLPGEIVWTTDTKQIFVGDGTQSGGLEIDYIGNPEKGVAGGVATLDANGELLLAQIPPEATVSTYEVADETAQLALTVTQGDLCKRTDELITYVALNSNNASMSDWMALNVPAKVNTVNGKQGDVVLTTTDIAEGTNLYFTDARADARIQAAIDDTNSSTSTLYSSSKIDSLVQSTLHYKGSWDASTNTPTLSDATGTANDYYIVSVGGTQDLGSGPITFNEGDDVIHNGTKWEAFGAVNAVNSVNGKTGTIVLDGSDIDLTGYVIGSTNVAIDPTNSINEAIGILEYRANQVVNNVQADWAETNTSAESYIQNKPTLVQDFIDLGDTPAGITTGDIGKVVRVQSETALEFDFLSIGELENVDVAADDYTTLDTNASKNILAWTPNTSVPADGKWGVHNIDTLVTIPFTQLTDTPSDYSAGAGFVATINAAQDGLEFKAPSAVGRTTLAALDDTNINSPSVNQVLTFDGTNWANQALPTYNLNSLTDVTIGTLADGDCLSYNATSGKWENSQPQGILFSIGELTNVDTSADSATSGQVLKYNGSAWAPAADSQTTTFEQLTDTPATGSMSSAAGYTLKVNAAGDAIEYVDTSVVDGGTF